jgi:drug/metabolite transporter (DMT)-like permease
MRERAGQDRTGAAAASILSGMAVIGLIDQSVRLIAEATSLWTFHLLRALMIGAVAGAWLVAARRRLRVSNPRGLAARSAVMSVAMIVYFGALGFLPVAQVAAGLFTAPIWVLAISATAYGRPIGPRQVTAVALGFAGVVLVLGPEVLALSPWAALPALAGAAYALAVIATREWCADEGPLELALGVFAAMGLWGLGGVLLMGGEGFLGAGWVAPSPGALGWIAVQAAGSLGAVVLLSRAYLLTEASVVSVFEYSILAFSALFGWLVWGDVLGPTGTLGLAMIAGAGMLVVGRTRAAPA